MTPRPTATEFLLRVRVDAPITVEQFSDEVAHHLAALIRMGSWCGNVSFKDGPEGEWVLERR